jgi:hypothetical protein
VPRALPDSVIQPVPIFKEIVLQVGSFSNKQFPTSAWAGGTNAQVWSTWFPPGKRTLRSALNALWRRQKAAQRLGELESKRTSVGRWLLDRKGGPLDIGAVYDARAHLVSAGIALEDGRPGAAEASMQAADALLNEFHARVKEYWGK